MIRYTLRCDQGHQFEAWYASGAAYDTLRASGRLECAVCGSAQVEKALMAPAIPTGAPAGTPAPAEPHQGTEDIAARIAAWRRHVEKTSEYVGVNFVTQARAMHLGDMPERAIWGEARLDEARALADEGVPVAPLPFVPRAKTN